MTTPNPVRRANSATMSPVRASEVPWGAAITMPRVPVRPEIRPGTPSISRKLVSEAQPATTRGPIAKLIAHQNRLRERIFPFVGQREQHVAPAPAQADLPGFPRQDERRRLGALPAHLQLAPAYAQLQPGPQRLAPRLFGGEARREVRHGIAPRATVGDLVLGEHPVHEALLPAIDQRAHARDADQVDADTRDFHASPICARMSPARSSAIARIRTASAPSIMTRASDSVPEYRIRMRPRPLISCSKAPTRSPTPLMESIGGLERTGTLTSTWGNLRRQVASAASGSPVSAATLSRASAERMPSPAGEWSRKRRWPDCSPPRLAPSRCISSKT